MTGHTDRNQPHGEMGRVGDRLPPLPPAPKIPNLPLPPPVRGVADVVLRRVNDLNTDRQQFFRHFSIFLAVNLLLFVIDVADGGGWWFFWPLFGWGLGVAGHASRVFGLSHASLHQFHPRTEAPSRPAPSTSTSADGESLIQTAETRVAKLWRTARLVPTPAVRDQAFRVCAAADRVAETLAADATDASTVQWFIDRYLAPTEAILERYVRVATRGVSGAESTLAKVENHDLPRLEQRFDSLYERLHRGDVIDLEVASEMLEIETDSTLPEPRRRST